MAPRILLPALSAALLGGCGVKRLLPTGPVLRGDALAPFDVRSPAGVAYTGPAEVSFPVLPIQVFGFYYDLDLIVASKHPSWDLHEYARIDSAEGPIWMAKDSDLDGVQTIVSGRPDLSSIVAEIPVPRLAGDLTVKDRSKGKRVEVDLSYVNAEGELTELEFRGRQPTKAPGKRNGSVMGHSRQAVAAVLDLTGMATSGSVRMHIGGKRVRVRRILGLVPFRMAVAQDQSGIAVTSFRQQGVQGGFTLVRPAGADERDPVTGAPGWPTARTETWTAGEGVATYDNGISRFVYHFLEGGLSHAEVYQWNRELPTFELFLAPALPDLSRPFEGTAVSRFRMDVNGQRGHGTGELRAWWEDGTVHTELRPTEPWWLADRPMDGGISFPDDGSVVVQMWRTDPPPKAPALTEGPS